MKKELKRNKKTEMRENKKKKLKCMWKENEIDRGRRRGVGGK